MKSLIAHIVLVPVAIVFLPAWLALLVFQLALIANSMNYGYLVGRRLKTT